MMVQKKSADMSKEMLDLISQFTQEAQHNSQEQNVENLNELKNLHKEIKNSLGTARDAGIQAIASAFGGGEIG